MADVISAPPASLAARGITTLADNLPDGARLSIGPGEFQRWFHPEIEARLFGWSSPNPPRSTKPLRKGK